MQRRRKYSKDCEGRLPAMAPLANGFVPFQMENPQKYEPRKAIIRGTLFPGLDLPFKGMVNKQEKPVTPMSQLQTMAFVLQEMALYLDTHRNDTEALEVYRLYQQLYHDAMMAYSRDCSPLRHDVPVDGDYCWLNDPWPWEYCKNKEA